MREPLITCQIRVKNHNHAQLTEQYMLDNVLHQGFDVTAPNQVWLSDSTEVCYGTNGEHKMRLSGVLGLYECRLLASNLTLTQTAEAEVQVFQRTLNTVGVVRPLVHTDCGSAYTSKAFHRLLMNARFNTAYPNQEHLTIMPLVE